MINKSNLHQQINATELKIKKLLTISLLIVVMLFPKPTQCGPFYAVCVAACSAACGVVVGVAPGPWAPLEIIACMEYCPGTCILSCFHKNTTAQVLENDKTVEKNIAEVHIGDMVATFHDGAFAWTKVLRNIKKAGNFDFVQITAENKETGNHHEISVTPTHGMVLLGDDNQLILDTADHVVIGNKIIAANGDALTVVDIKHDVMYERYTLETAEGTVLASGMFVSTLCAEELEGGKKPFNATIEDWQKRHHDVLT